MVERRSKEIEECVIITRASFLSKNVAQTQYIRTFWLHRPSSAETLLGMHYP